MGQLTRGSGGSPECTAAWMAETGPQGVYSAGWLNSRGFARVKTCLFCASFSKVLASFVRSGEIRIRPGCRGRIAHDAEEGSL